jgi:uncharacterized membrane protein YebE (DUF533 family)
MFNSNELLGQLLKTGLSGGLGLGRKRRRGGSLLGGMSTGAKAQIGMGLVGVAIAAYEHFSRQKAEVGGATVPYQPDMESRVPSSSAGEGPRVTTTDATLMVQAMVAAAAADGMIDEAERAQMLKRASDAGFDDETQRFLEREIANPKSLAVIASSARPEIATDLYAASYSAITADTDAERVYLQTLAKRLGLSDEARDEIHRQLDQA